MFSETAAAAMSGLDVHVCLLVWMDFRGAPRRWWMGAGDLEAGGHTWQGMGKLAAIDGLTAPSGTAAPETVFTLSGVDAEIVALARAASDRVKGRDCVVYVQFFYGPGASGGLTWGLLDSPYAILSGTMEGLSFAASGPSERSISVTMESLWAGRNRAPFGLYTPQDQKARWPGDKGLNQVPDLAGKTIRWPVV